MTADSYFVRHHMYPSCLTIIALGLCGSCRSPLVLHEGNIGIGSYTCSSASPAEGASYAIRGTGLETFERPRGTRAGVDALAYFGRVVLATAIVRWFACCRTGGAGRTT